MLSKLGGRKFIFMVIAVAVGVAVDLTTDRGLSTNLKELLMGVGFLYTIGNIGSHVTQAVKNKSQPPAIDTSEIDEVKIQMDAMVAAINNNANNVNTIVEKIKGN